MADQISELYQDFLTGSYDCVDRIVLNGHCGLCYSPGGFPEQVRGDLGFALYELQQGRQPAIDTRRMESIGAGVYELKEADERTWYRVIYLSKIDDVIYVLHCFEKQSRKTDKRDLNIAKEHLSRVRQRIKGLRKHAKHREK